MRRVLVVDDEENMCIVLKMILEKDNCTVSTVNNGKDAIDLLKNNYIFDLIISDLRMPVIGGLEILNYLKKNGKDIPIILITAYGSIKTAVDAMKMGASDFITKPFNSDVIRHTVKSIFKIADLESENKYLKENLNEADLIYKSQSMVNIMEMLKKMSNISTPILITGESGSGKSLIAKILHNMSGGEKPFVKINCPSVPPTLFESELFGFRKGAFTGAIKDFKGKLRLADGGTVFLDEIADLPLSVQPKLLRILEDASFEPIGSNTTIKVNTRFICATNHDIKKLVKTGLFRKDLYYRINTITIDIPPLREKIEDIIPLAEYFLQKYSKKMGKNIKGFSKTVKKAFLLYNWPGNIRELKNLIERVVVFNNSKIVNLTDISFKTSSCFDDIMDNGEAVKENKLSSVEKKILLDTLNKNNWNISKTARELGITRGTLRYRIGKYKINKVDMNHHSGWYEPKF